MRVVEISKEGLPNMDDLSLTGRIAFIHDGNIIDGFPLTNGNWEANSKWRTGYSEYADVKKYIIFDVPIWEL